MGNANGARNPFYESMREVAPGDMIFSFMDTRSSRSGLLGSIAGKAPSHRNSEVLVRIGRTSIGK
jgi:hypothetical protein